MKNQSITYEPEKIENLENIVKIDVGNNVLFPLDHDGNLDSLGVLDYENSK